MTGTADTEAVRVPPDLQARRRRHPDQPADDPRRQPGRRLRAPSARSTRRSPTRSSQLREKGQPVLVGTVSIEKSERLSDLLKQRKVPHVVLNAKFHEKEAEIVAQAGRSGAVTIATNMAGRGTDIVLGGNPDAVAAHELQARSRTRPSSSSGSRELRATCADGQGRRSSPPAASTSSAPSATSRAASTTSCAAAPAARATPAPRASTSRSKTT